MIKYSYVNIYTFYYFINVIIIMTYNFNIVKSSINLYNELKKKNIKGIEREQLIINTFSCSISTFYKWYFLYNNLSNSDFDNHFLNKKRKPKILKEHIEFILKIAKNNIMLHTKGIKKQIKKELNISISKSSINTILHKNNLSFKKIYKQINPYTKIELKKEQKKLKRKINKIGIENIKSIDEFSIHLNETPKKSWSTKGEQHYYETKNKNIYGKKYTLCMSIDIHKNISYLLKEKSIKGDDFNTFISSINKNKKTTLLIDNARIHHSKLFKQNINKNKLKIIYGIPYYSKYNPIEYIFSLLRKEIENNDCNNEKDIKKTVDNFIKNLNKDTIKNTYQHVLKILN